MDSVLKLEMKLQIYTQLVLKIVIVYGSIHKLQ